MSVPEDILANMADAMLEPELRNDLPRSASGTAVRVKVLLRALKAAADHGWELQSIIKSQS